MADARGRTRTLRCDPLACGGVNAQYEKLVRGQHEGEVGGASQ